MKVCVNLTHWADDLIGDNEKVKFAIRLALLNSGRDYGASMGVSCSPVGEPYVYNPYKIDVRCESVTSIHYEEGKPDSRTVEVFEFSFVAKSFSVPSIYEGAMEALRKA